MTPTETSEPQPLKVLLVDDEPVALRHYVAVLKSIGGVEIFQAMGLNDARQILAETPIDVAFIDLQLSTDTRNRDGLTLIQEIRSRYLTVPVVVSQRLEVSAAMKLGAEDYVIKAEFEQRIPVIIKSMRRDLELKDLRARGAPGPEFDILGLSDVIQNLRAQIQRFATAEDHNGNPATVLILGPSGSGKELVARALHKLGPHPREPFFAINCSTITENLIEDQLFGHVKEAFTGAAKDQHGYFTLVGQGTLFLDEMGEMSPGLQAKLLRVLDYRTFRPVGATDRELRFRGRIMAATHVDLKEQVRTKRFREDLYYRLNLLTVRVPPLSEHREDIPILIQHFASKHRKRVQFTQQAIELLSRYDWPGNVRELIHTIDRLIILSDTDLIDAAAVERGLFHDTEKLSDAELLKRLAQQILELPVPDKINAITRALVIAAMEKTGNNVTEAAKLLGKHRKVVERLIKKFFPPGKR